VAAVPPIEDVHSRPEEKTYCHGGKQILNY
jgi:hypothetical protein